MPNENARHWYKNPAIIVPITVAIIGAIAMIATPIFSEFFTQTHTSTPPEHKKFEINITSPLDNSIISGDAIQVEGHLSKQLYKNQYLYTVVEAKEPLWWPEQAIPTHSHISESYEFKCTHWIGETADVREILEIKVILVDSAIHDMFQTWRRNCIEIDDWPGIPITNVYEWGEWETCASVTVIYE
jgi:hypothetical protein